MSEAKCLTKRNEQIAAMLADGEQLKNFYRFIAQNPHINLHDACQIIIERPNATVCYSFNEWAAMDRRVTKGRKGIAYYDIDGYKQFVFDANDTHGDTRYSRPILPMKRLLGGLDELNGTEIADSEQSDYSKIQKGVQAYLNEQGELTGDEEHDSLLTEGITYSLYSKTGFPKSAGIALNGLPYTYSENAEFVKEVYIQANLLTQDIEEAYQTKQEQVVIIDDTEEETVSDEPIVHTEQVEQITEERSEADEPKYLMYPLYKRYVEMQNEKPDAIVLTRLGDFYEVWGEKSKVVSDELNLTLTGRDVGLPERIPMCGIPQHFLDEFLDKILEKHGVLLAEDNEEPKYILSYAEALEQSEKEAEVKTNPNLTEITDDEPSPFDDEQSEADDDWRNELAAELGDMDDEQSDEETDGLDDSEEADEDEDLDSSSDEQDEQAGEKPKDKVKSTQKKSEKGIKDRKRKEKPQPTLLDLAEPQEKSRLEQVIETELRYGSQVQDGKFRIFDKYNENPSEKAFVEFLKKEYGWGGHSGWNSTCQEHSPKGIEIYLEGEKGEILERAFLKWPEVANRIADLIDDDNYFNEQEKQKYAAYQVEQNRLREQRAEAERQKNRFIEKVILDEPNDRKERIAEAYHESKDVKSLIEFVKSEYGAYTTKEIDDKRVVINSNGLYVSAYDESGNTVSRYSLDWDTVIGKIVTLIDNGKYYLTAEQVDIKSDELSTEEKIKIIVDNIVKEGTEKTTDGKWFVYFEDFKEDEQFVREHKHEITQQLVLREEVAQGGMDDISIDATFNLEYCPNYDWNKDDEKAAPTLNRFKELTAEERAFFESYQQRPVHEPTNSPWDEVQSCFTIANGIYSVTTEGHGGIMISKELAPYILSAEAIAEGYSDSDFRTGYLCYEEDEQKNVVIRELYDKGIIKKTDEYFTRCYVCLGKPKSIDDYIPFSTLTEEQKVEYFIDWDKRINEALAHWRPDYWKAHEQAELIVADNTENTDLTGVLDQSELGGAKTRFRNNVAAIKLVNKLYSENRNPTEAEKKVLSQFVGWGGLAQAFDEKNPQWKKEYDELKGLLSQEDYEQARGSTLNAYYTAKDVIGGIYTALNRFGVRGNNRILEPSMGTGNFFGFMPKDISDGSKLYGVELDNLTGRIAAKLYPQANVQIKGFEDTSFPNDKFDIVVGNVPFGGYGVADSDYNRYNFKVHDYFLAKSIDKVKPNGIVAIVTSKGTMDKLNPSARKYVAERAELLGAIRLPNTAFKQTAGTEAVADILFFRKRTEKTTDISNEDWLGTDTTEEGYEINRYFIKHPEMVLGKLVKAIGLYGGEDVTVQADGRELSEAIAEAVKNLPSDFYTNPETSPEEESTIEVDYNVKPMCYKAENSRLYMRIGDEMQEQAIPKFPKDAYQRIQGMIALREELHHILDLQIQGCSDEVLEREQRRLNTQYDLFVKRFGNLNGQTNTRLFKDDGDSALLLACEEVDEETKKVSKSDIFTKRTIRPYVVPTSTDDCFEALQISKNERGKVDISYIEELTGKSYDDVLFELGDAVFRDPEKTDRADKYSGFVTSEEYLSGKVVSKLNVARRYAEEYPEYRDNVTALEKVQPTKLTASEISVRLGQTWVDKEFYKQFYMDLIGANWWHEGSVELFYNPHDSSWRLDQKDNVRYETQMKQKEVYGTSRAPAYRLFIDCMNLKATTIYDTIEENGQERRVLNQAETIAAREKQNKIKEEFANWIFANPERREELEETYNRFFNQIRLPSYDGSYLKFPEMNPAIELREHQKNAIHRIITNDEGTLLHHVVGSGKTYTMAASIMKMRQLGLCKKAMVAVPNHLVQQWASEWRKLYPNAKILVATKEDLEKDNRKRFVSKVAMGDWDGIIIAQSSFAKIPVSTERQIKKLNEEIEKVEETIENQYAERGMPRGAIKNLERIKKNKQAQLKKLMDDSKKDSVLTFENLGVDYLYVDEAHYYKNLFLYTKMNNVAGISNAASQRASDLKMKCEYLQELHGNDKGIVFATGTPISNSMAEMYTMQSYLQPTTLKESGIDFFDGWAANFGETITSMELAPSGQGYKARTRFAKFTNLPELLTMYRSFADVQTADMVKLDVPEAERHVINLKPSDTVIELAEKIAERAEEIHSGSVPPEEDNMLKVTSDGKKLALDPRCFDPMSEDEEGSKLNEAAQRIYEVWESTAEKKGTQIVFCDLSTPKVKSEEYIYGLRFDAYNDLKYKLVQKGIPAEEVAFIHDANTDEQKQALFDKVNSGAIRVLIGSTEKCGAGTNVQKRLVALHHLDTPYRPSDMEQREGRIIRQGNTNEKVDIYTYVTERTFDSYSYQILENKQKFIAQINRGDLTVREAEDIDETTLNYAEIKAITAANPRIKRKMEVDTEIARLRVLEGQFRKNLYDLQDKIRKNFPEDIRKQELLVERVTLDLMHLNSSKPTNPEAFEISVNGKVYTDRKEGGKALTDALYASKPETVVAEYCGFKISMNPMTSLAGEREVTLTANGQYTVKMGESSSGNLTRLDNFMEDFPNRKVRLENKLAQLKNDLAIAEEQVLKPFEHKEHLAELLKEQSELNAELNLDKKEESMIIDDGNDLGNEEHYRDLPTQKDRRELNIIDEEDKVAEMRVEVLPDYSITQDDMHEYGYKWDGMLPLNRTTALRLWGIGLSVCKLGKDDDHVEVDDYRDFNDTNAIYGIEKPVWNNYLHNEKSLPYLMARLQVAEASKQVTSKDLDCVDERFTISFIETNSKERTALAKYLADKPKSEGKEMKVYVPHLLDEFSKRLWCDAFRYYGWMQDDVPKSIANYIADAELKAYAKKVVSYSFDTQAELMRILNRFTEEEVDEMNLPAFDDELTVVDKEPSIYLDETEKTYLPGLLMLRNEVTGDYYVINDTSAKSEEGNELEVGDTTDVETVLAYNGMNDGNPLHEFHDEREARVYFDEKVNAIRSVKANSTDNVTAVINSVILEYDKYKKAMLNSTPDEVFLNNYKIHLYNELSEVIKSGTDYLSETEFEALRKEGSHILEQLFDDYCGQEGYNVETYGETARFIQEYCERYHSEVYETKPTNTQNANEQDQNEGGEDLSEIDYMQEVTESVSEEYNAFYEEVKGLEQDEMFGNGEKMQWYRTLADYLCESELVSAEVFKALYKDRGHILENLYNEISDFSDKDTFTYKEIAKYVERYCERSSSDFIRTHSVYLHTGKYAYDNGEVKQYQKSREINYRCKKDIEEAIANNFDGMHLNSGFEDALIEKYGIERIAHVIASTIITHEYDGRFSKTNKEWAHTIPVSTEESERDDASVNVHPAVLDGFTDRIRKKHNAAYEKPTVFYANKFDMNGIEEKLYIAVYLDEKSGEINTLLGKNLRTEKEIDELIYKINNDKDTRRDCTYVKISYDELLKKSQTIKKEEETELAEEKFKNFTARGDKVLSITKDRDDRNIAIIKREKIGDFVVAAGYNTTDGTWAQGKYDFKKLEDAEKFRKENYSFENMSDTAERRWLTCKVSPEALIKKYQFNTRFSMPKGSGYEGYAYSLFNDRIKEGTFTTDLKSDTRVRALILHIPTDKNMELRKGEDIIEIEPHDFISLVNGTMADKYEREQRYIAVFPPEAIIKEYDTSMLLAMPNDTKYKGYVYYMPAAVVSENRDRDDGTLIANIGESFKITLRKGEEKVEITAKEYSELVGGKKAEQYKREPSAMDDYREQQGDDEKKWKTVEISENAVIANYQNSTLFKMPKGEHEGLVYYIPSGMVKKEDDKLSLRIPEDFEVHLKDSASGDTVNLTAEQFIAEIEGKTDEDYKNLYRRPSEEAQKQFEKVEMQLRKHVPEEMRKKPNWVVVRTRDNAETGRLDKFLIDVHTGKFAESDNPATWADFETACKYARENGGVALAYALEWDSDIACIDLDGCMNENGDFSEIAQQAFAAASGSYTETSISGKGLHIFGKTKGADLRSFSKDKTMEYYQGGHFIAMTGDNYGSSELKSFDTPMMQRVLESKLERRTEWKNTGKGVEGLSSMDDREMLDRAFAAKNGDIVKRLYNGEDIRGNHSNSDMSLMNYLAFWSNHDIDQMLRVFSTSGLYRADKPQSYYEHTAIKAVKGTPCYTPPKASNSAPKASGSGNSKA